MVRYIGMGVHREFAQLAVLENGVVRDEGGIGVTPQALRAWAAGPGSWRGCSRRTSCRRCGYPTTGSEGCAGR
jgi:hypothetical protein